MKKSESYLNGLIRVGFMIKKSFMRENRTRGLSLAKIGILHMIAWRKNTTIKDVALEIGVTMPSVSALIDELENKGLIRRISSSKDRRVTYLILTTKGKLILKREIEKMYRRVGEIFKQLSEADQKKLFDIYRKIYLISNKTNNNKSK